MQYRLERRRRAANHLVQMAELFHHQIVNAAGIGQMIANTVIGWFPVLIDFFNQLIFLFDGDAAYFFKVVDYRHHAFKQQRIQVEIFIGNTLNIGALDQCRQENQFIFAIDIDFTDNALHQGKFSAANNIGVGR